MYITTHTNHVSCDVCEMMEYWINVCGVELPSYKLACLQENAQLGHHLHLYRRDTGYNHMATTACFDIKSKLC